MGEGRVRSCCRANDFLTLVSLDLVVDILDVVAGKERREAEKQ